MGSEDSEGRRRGIYPFMQRLLFGFFFDIFFLSPASDFSLVYLLFYVAAVLFFTFFGKLASCFHTAHSSILHLIPPLLSSPLLSSPTYSHIHTIFSYFPLLFPLTQCD